MLFNTPNDVYEIQGSPGNFTYTQLGHFCIADSNIESSAMHGDTLYLVASDLELYQVLLNTGACKDLTNLDPNVVFGSVNNLTCDNNGLLYYIFVDTLFRYDPHQNTITSLGFVPVSPSGDLFFYNNLLLCAGNGAAIWAIDPNNPAAAYQLMTTGTYFFYGLLEIPDNCQQNRLFGIDAAIPGNIVEIDPLTWTLGNVVGTLPGLTIAYDAASTSEDGTITGVVFDSLALLSPCGNGTTGNIQAFASSAWDGGTTYTLDGTTTNTTGIFSGVPIGTHTIEIAATAGCTADSTVAISQGLSSVTYQIAGPEDCAHPSDGSILVTAGSQALPILYSLGNNVAQSSPSFGQLDTGTYTLKVVDAGHCEKDTSIALGFQHILPFPATLAASPAFCAETNGSLALTLNNGVAPGNFAATLNADPAPPSQTFTGLAGGTYTLKITYNGTCNYDSVVTIPRQQDAAPAVQATIRNQTCFTANGNITLAIAGTSPPYSSSLNNGAFTTNSSFDGLAPGNFMVSVQDGNGCIYDTVFAIQPYPRDSLTLSIDTVDPVCTTLNSGSLTITVQGDQAPYWLTLGNATYASGTTIPGLSRGDFSLPVIDKDGCVVDSAHAHLDLDIEPQCEMVYVPNAFTPDGNGVNDLFRVLRSPYIQVTGFRVFNRYGGLVFSGSDQRPGWDGTFHGEPQPAGTYVWEVAYIDLENIARSVHGIVVLLR
jgi:gliding motility-associated-like protein